ncbi:hypothetical protein MAIT1_02711 [Magnetofaba australis IT-1]|uniref:Uncharacterized protein n=2 Tax=Magnetofaba TaxID=1472292 RepID=A0A1Y2K3N4_9PROT|nr:hypothetical protein MAIT1_02711 [Magnetofaba australis IT-1]
MYRLSLKSTFWLYFPLVYISKTPTWNSLNDIHEASGYLDRLRNSWNEWRKRLLAALAIASLLVANLSPEMLNHVLKEIPQSSMLFYAWVFEWGNFAPWQWLLLANAALTVILPFPCDTAYRTWRHDNTHNKDNLATITWAKGLNLVDRLRNVLGWFYLIMAFGYALIAMGTINQFELPSGFGFLLDLYGPYLPKSEGAESALVI